MVRGLEFLFKRKARLNPTKGTGVWIALQYWYVTGMSRDESEPDEEASTLENNIGPEYHKLFPPETRFHFWEICEALQIDLILVEDGITFRRFVRVLRMMFEIYDMHSGQQRAEEMHFTGLPGVKVVLHEFDLAYQEKLGRDDYPEPNYDELARGRVMHIFKDREEHEERVEPPKVDDWVPVLTGV